MPRATKDFASATHNFKFCLEASTIVPWRHEGLCPEAANDLEPRLRLVPCHERLCLIATNDCALSHERLACRPVIVRGDKAQSFVAIRQKRWLKAQSFVATRHKS